MSLGVWESPSGRLSRQYRARSHERTASGSDRGRVAFDPRDPYGSAVAGDHQFTAIADTNHEDPAIIEDVARNIPAMAHAGLRHVLIESYLRPLEDVEAHWPELRQAGTLREKAAMASEKLDRYYTRILEDTFTCSSLWGLDPYQTELRLLEQTRSEFDDISALTDPVILRDLIDRINDPHSGITPEEVHMRAPLFRSYRDPSGATAKAYATLYLACRRHDVKVHYTGDRRGFEPTPATIAAQEDLNAFLADSRNADLLPVNESLAQIAAPEEWSAAFNALSPEMRRQLETFWHMRNAIDNLRAADRMSAEAERERAIRFIECARGQKALAIWGRLHFVTDQGINIHLDRILAETSTRGRNNPTVVMSVYRDRQAHARQPDYGATRESHLRRFIATNQTIVTRSGADVFNDANPRSRRRVESAFASGLALDTQPA